MNNDDIMELDFYLFLDIPINASLSQITTAYRKKSLTCHPDQNPDNKNATNNFLLLKRVFDILANETTRKAYDQILFARYTAKCRNGNITSNQQKINQANKSNKTTSKIVIGIDLGTTYSCVGIFQNGKVHIIPNGQGNRTTPSYVAFTDVERLIGDEAKRATDTKNMIFNVKRLIGCKFDDPKLQADMKRWPFKVINVSGKPKLTAEFKGEMKVFSPEEISSMILAKMKETAETFLGETVRNAVITVPAYFTDSQRQATKDAGEIAGLNVLRILNEPSAGALAYGLDRNLRGMKKIMIFDLGGGTFDISILTIHEGSSFKVNAIAGDTHLGGEDFDERLVEYLVDEFKKKYGKDIRKNRRALRRLKNAAERAKRNLSSTFETTIDLDYLYNGLDLFCKVSRVKFEELCSDLFKSTLNHVEKALKDANMSKHDIHDVVLVGGSTRIPKIQELLQNFFNGKYLNRSINPDEGVAYGAAIQAAMLSNDSSQNIRNMSLLEVTPLSLGIEVQEQIMSKIIERNSKIPCVKSGNYTTVFDNQTVMRISVYEGERSIVTDNKLLGEFRLRGIPPMPRKIPKIIVTFNIDSDGILNVSAVELSTRKMQNIVIKADNGRLSREEIDRMINEADWYKEEDNKRKQNVQVRINLETYVYDVKKSLDNAGSKLHDSAKNYCKQECDNVLEWMKNNAMADTENLNSEIRKLHEICSAVFSRAGIRMPSYRF